MAFITIEGENEIAAKQGASQVLDIDEFVLANIAGLGAEPASRIETLPAPGDIVDQLAVSKAGYVNANQVVYSLSLDSTIGPYTFNWVGIKTVDDILIAAEYLAAPINKVATVGATPGNNLVRNFLLAYSGIMATTAIGVPASTWQIDFTTRLLEIDERERLSNLDEYGPGAFFGSGFLVKLVSGTDYSVEAGIGYVGGIRLDRLVTANITATPFPTAVWVDASLQGDINGVQPVYSFVVSNSVQSDYTDGNGFKHYLIKIADIASGGAVTDVRVVHALPVASTTMRGIVELATAAETLAGTDNERAVTPNGLSGINQVALDALDFPTISTPTNRAGTTSASATNGGTVSIPADVITTLGEEFIGGETGCMSSFKAPAYDSQDLDVSSTYYIRARWIAGAFTYYFQKGTDSDAIPAALTGTPGASSGGGFDSTVLDILYAKVVTGTAGTVPVVTDLANAARLFGEYLTDFLIDAADVETKLMLLDWGRAPRITHNTINGVHAESYLWLLAGTDTGDAMRGFRLLSPVVSRYKSQTDVWVFDNINNNGESGAEIKFTAEG